MAGFADRLKNRKKEIDEATEEPKSASPMKTPPPEPEESVTPAKRKVFSDGIEREWDDHAQHWVPLNPSGFQKAR